MALQDLTPQLRTRLSRMERAVGLFVMLALGLLVFGFGYYVYNTAERKGWFLTKAPYFTYVQDASGLKVGDPVRLMGFDAGTISEIKPMSGDQFEHNVYVEFVLKSPNYGYVWTDGSRAKVNTADFLGKRVLEVTKGIGGYPTYVFHPVSLLNVNEAKSGMDLTRYWLAEELYSHATNLIGVPLKPITNIAEIAQEGYKKILVMDTNETRKVMTGIWDDKNGRYEIYTNGTTKPYWLLCDESPAVTERLEQLVSLVETNLPGIFALTNQLHQFLSNGSELVSNLNTVATEARPAVSNLAVVTSHLDRPGALGEWLLPTNLNHQLEGTLTNANAALVSANTNLAALAENLNRSLENLSGITSNLNAQVQANTNLVKAISDAIIHADQFIQGLKHHWLFRSAFKTKEPIKPAQAPATPLKSPKDKTRRE